MGDYSEIDKGWHAIKNSNTDMEKYTICSQLMGLDSIVRLLKIINGANYEDYSDLESENGFRIRLLPDIFHLFAKRVDIEMKVAFEYLPHFRQGGSNVFEIR